MVGADTGGLTERNGRYQVLVYTRLGTKGLYSVLCVEDVRNESLMLCFESARGGKLRRLGL
jgi:hypothetical protein